MTTYADIDSSNFSQYFFNIRDYQPQQGQVIARFRAVAELVDGEEKKFLIHTLQRPNSARAAANMMIKVFCADQNSSWQVPLEIGKDLLNGMSEEEVSKKPYEFIAEFCYYTNRECVPVDDVHWEIIEIIRPKKLDEIDI
jgi:hypothetical protein